MCGAGWAQAAGTWGTQKGRILPSGAQQPLPQLRALDRAPGPCGLAAAGSPLPQRRFQRPTRAGDSSLPSSSAPDAAAGCGGSGRWGKRAEGRAGALLRDRGESSKEQEPREMGPGWQGPPVAQHPRKGLLPPPLLTPQSSCALRLPTGLLIPQWVILPQLPADGAPGARPSRGPRHPAAPCRPRKTRKCTKPQYARKTGSDLGIKKGGRGAGELFFWVFLFFL